MIPTQTPLREWEDATPWEKVFAGCGVLTPRTAWSRQPERDDDAPTTQRWADDAGHGLVICANSTTDHEEVWDDELAPTGWLALTEEAQNVHRAGKVDILAHVCGVSVADAAEAVGVLIDPDQDRFDLWRRGKLCTIARYALSRETSPYAVLGGVLTLIAANTSPHVYFPGRRRASFNLIICTIGASSKGKGTAADLADDLVRIEGDTPPRAERRRLSTWQGLQKRMQMPDFAARERLEGAETTDAPSSNAAEIPPLEERKGFASGMDEGFRFTLAHAPVVYDGKYAGKRYAFAHTNRHFGRVDEFASFLGDRNGGGGGAGMQPLAAMMTGEEVGADNVGDSRDVPAHSYRLALLVAGQPKLLRGLLRDVDGGVAQRFVWVPTADPDLSTLAEAENLLGKPLPGEGAFPAEEEQVVLTTALRERTGPVDVHPAVTAEVKRRGRLRPRHTTKTLREDIAAPNDDFNGHLPLTTLRLHFLISVLLYGEMRSTVEAWVIADALACVSEWTRTSVLVGTAKRARGERVAETTEEMEDRETAEAAVAASRLARCHDRLTEALTAAGAAGCTMSELRKRVDPRSRDAMVAAVDEGIAEGRLRSEQTTAANGAVSQRIWLSEAR